MDLQPEVEMIREEIKRTHETFIRSISMLYYDHAFINSRILLNLTAALTNLLIPGAASVDDDEEWER
jgi:hypothetical protein